MPSSFTEKQRREALEEARAAVRLREFWEQPSSIRTKSIWANVETAINSTDSRWGFFSFESLRYFRGLLSPRRVRYAPAALAVTVAIIGGAFAYSQLGGHVDDAGAAKERSVDISQQGIPGYADAIVHYREGLADGDAVDLDKSPIVPEAQTIPEPLVYVADRSAQPDVGSKIFEATAGEPAAGASESEDNEFARSIVPTVQVSEAVLGALEIATVLTDEVGEVFGSGVNVATGSTGIIDEASEALTTTGRDPESGGVPGLFIAQHETPVAGTAPDSGADPEPDVEPSAVEPPPEPAEPQQPVVATVAIVATPTPASPDQGTVDGSSKVGEPSEPAVVAVAATPESESPDDESTVEPTVEVTAKAVGGEDTAKGSGSVNSKDESKNTESDDASSAEDTVGSTGDEHDSGDDAVESEKSNPNDSAHSNPNDPTVESKQADPNQQAKNSDQSGNKNNKQGDTSDSVNESGDMQSGRDPNKGDDDSVVDQGETDRHGSDANSANARGNNRNRGVDPRNSRNARGSSQSEAESEQQRQAQERNTRRGNNGDGR